MLACLDFFKTSATIYFQKKINKDLKFPWMSKKEIYILKNLILKYNSNYILEWGSGYSTFYFSQLSPNIKWYSIEHDKLWYNNIITQMNQFKNVSLNLVEPDHFPWSDVNNDGDFNDLFSYVLFPKQNLINEIEKGFDLILIDGRARKFCLEKSHELISNNGIVIVHDANRKHYFENREKKFKYEYFFNDSREDGGLFIASNSSIKDDMIKLKRVWNLF